MEECITIQYMPYQLLLSWVCDDPHHLVQSRKSSQDTILVPFPSPYQLVIIQCMPHHRLSYTSQNPQEGTQLHTSVTSGEGEFRSRSMSQTTSTHICLLALALCCYCRPVVTSQTAAVGAEVAAVTEIGVDTSEMGHVLPDVLMWKGCLETWYSLVTYFGPKPGSRVTFTTHSTCDLSEGPSLKRLVRWGRREMRGR